MENADAILRSNVESTKSVSFDCPSSPLGAHNEASHRARAKVPQWLDTALIQEALQPEDARVVDIEVHYAVPLGENYASTMYRVRATLEDGDQRSFVVKGPHGGELTFATATNVGFFRHEALMLTRIVPEMQRIMDEASRCSLPKFAARCPMAGERPVEFLVMEDLRPRGFRLADRKRGLGLRHCLLVVRSLARFHAASAPLLARDDLDVAEMLGNPLAVEGPDSYEASLKACVKGLANACRSWVGFEEYVDFLDDLTPRALRTFASLLRPRPGKFNVVVHADVWTNNIMFRYENGRPHELRMIDFQMSTVSSPVTDLLFFLGTSPSDDVSQHHEGLLLREYHAALQEAMEMLGLSAPPLRELLADMDELGLFALYGIAFALPVVRASGVSNMEATIGEHNSTAALAMFQDPAVTRWVQRVLPLYRQRGWIRF